MKFKLVENIYSDYTELRNALQDYLYDAVDEVGNASLQAYLDWFYNELPYEDKELLTKVATDVYIELIDAGKIRKEKTMITSQLKEYIESNQYLLEKPDELMAQCPDILKHELQLVLDKMNESLNEELLTDSYKQLWSQFDALEDLLLPDVDYDLHHIYNSDKSLDNGNVNYLILPKYIHKKFPRNNTQEAVKIYNELKSKYPEAFKSINVTFEVCNIDTDISDYLNNEKKYRKSVYNKNRYQWLKQMKNTL